MCSYTKLKKDQQIGYIILHEPSRRAYHCVCPSCYRELIETAYEDREVDEIIEYIKCPVQSCRWEFKVMERSGQILDYNNKGDCACGGSKN